MCSLGCVSLDLHNLYLSFTALVGILFALAVKRCNLASFLRTKGRRRGMFCVVSYVIYPWSIISLMFMLGFFMSCFLKFLSHDSLSYFPVHAHTFSSILVSILCMILGFLWLFNWFWCSCISSGEFSLFKSSDVLCTCCFVSCFLATCLTSCAISFCKHSTYFQCLKSASSELTVSTLLHFLPFS